MLSTLSTWLLPMLILCILVVGTVRRVPLYNTFVDGAKSGFGISVRLIPHLIAMMVAVQVFRASGAMEMLVRVIAPVAKWLHIPPDVVPLALLRPITNAGSLAVLTEIFKGPHKPDTWVGMLASTMQASSDTTLFIITVYFGSVGVQNIRYALKVGLLSDAASVFASIVAVWLLLGKGP